MEEKRHDVFNKKHEDAMEQDKRAILEELNLPPAVVDFIRKNSKNLKIAIACIVIAIIAWEGYGKYREVQVEKSASMLYTAIQKEEPDQRQDALRQVVQEYKGEDSGKLAMSELGNIAYDKGDYQEAVNQYSQVLDKISKKNPLYPLVLYSLALSYQNNSQPEKSISAFEELMQFKGFDAEAYVGLGRLYESQGNTDKALEMYENYANLSDIQANLTMDWVQDKISKLRKD